MKSSSKLLTSIIANAILLKHLVKFMKEEAPASHLTDFVGWLRWTIAIPCYIQCGIVERNL